MLQFEYIFLKRFQTKQGVDVPPAPPIVIRTQPPPAQPKEPLIIREAPPKMPPPIGRKFITIYGPKNPPPRKVIIQKMPAIEKAQPIIIERWLAPKIPPRRVVFENNSTQTQNGRVRNEIHVCEAPSVVTEKQFKDLGVSRVDPNDVILIFNIYSYLKFV